MAHKKDPADWKIKRYRSGDDHVHACQKGYAAPSPYTNTHHVITISSMADGTISTQLNSNQPQIDFIMKCLKKTVWDINAAGNLVRLPMKEVWRNELLAPPGWDKHPCHQVDHYIYNREVNDDLKTNVWECSIENAKECNFRSKSFAGALRARQKHLLSELNRKGNREGGTKFCWDNCDKMPTTWYMPFSMADAPNRRSPPAKKPSSGMASYLQAIFKSI
jgi:hypothetical protein